MSDEGSVAKGGISGVTAQTLAAFEGRVAAATSGQNPPPEPQGEEDDNLEPVPQAEGKPEGTPGEQPNPQAPPPPAEPAQEPTDQRTIEYWRHACEKAKQAHQTLQGIFKKKVAEDVAAQVAGHREEIAYLRGQVKDLQQQLAAAAKGQPATAGHAPEAGAPATRRTVYTAEQRQSIGADVVDPMEARIGEIEDRLAERKDGDTEGLKKELAKLKNQLFFGQIDTTVRAAGLPPLSEIEAHPEYEEWLATKPAGSRWTYNQSIQESLRAGDIDTLVQILRLFHEAHGGAQNPPPHSSVPDQRSQIQPRTRRGNPPAPQSPRRLSDKEITALYTQHQKGFYADHPAEWERIEQSINAELEARMQPQAATQ